jgi:NADH dehydrogenase
MKKVLVTGASGFVGNAVIRSLTEHGYTPVAFIRKGSEDKLKSNAEIRYGDILDKSSISEALTDIYAVIHLVGIIREIPSKSVTFINMHSAASQNIAEACAEKNVGRIVHMSANGTRQNAVSMYHITKYEGESAVKKSGLNYTIFRPSLIYGEDDSFINMLASFIRKTPVFSYFGDGSYPMQPIHVDEVAQCFVRAIDNSSTYGMTYPLCGKNVYTYKELLKLVGKALGKNLILVPVPEFAVSAGISIFGGFDWFPITKDQFTMLKEGNICECNDALKILDVKPCDFFEKISSYL